MRFSLDMVVPVFEAAGLNLVLGANANAPAKTFLYADTLIPSPLQENNDAHSQPAALAVVDADAISSIEPHILSSRPILAVVGPKHATGQGANPLRANDSAIAFVATSRSCAEVCSAINRYLVSIREWDAEMANSIRNGCSNQDLLELSEPFLGSYLALSDALYSAVAIMPSFPPLDDMSRSLVETGMYPADMLPAIEHIANDQAWHSQPRSRLDQAGNDINPCPNMSRIYRLNGNYAAHLVMVRPSPIEPWRQALFDLLADRVGECLTRFWSTSLPYRGKSASFLSAMLENAVHDEADFKKRARMFDFPETGVFEVGVISGAEERGGVAHIVHQISIGIKGCRVAVLGQRIYVLIISSEKEAGKLASIEHALFDIAARLHAEIGVSSRFDALENCHMARLEADVALEYGHKNYSKYRALQEKNPHLDCVFRFNRYFPCYLVDPYSDTAEFMAEYAKSPNIVNRLRKADRDNGTNDYGLLKIYLYYDCSIKQTAEIMNMHRNTVIYRLNKIRNDYFIDLDDSDTRLFLHYLFGVLD